MIRYNLDNDSNAVDETGKKVKLSSFPHFDGNYWYDFDTEEERMAFIEANTIRVWSKEAYADELNAAHNAHFRQMYLERNYLSIGEISLWITDEEFGAEAEALVTWWRITCKTVSDYLQNVTEESDISIGDFIASLPQLQLPE